MQTNKQSTPEVVALSVCFFLQRIANMSYTNNNAVRASLFPWTIVRLFPTLQGITVARFRKRSDAEGHLQVLRRMMPQAEFAIVFEVSK